MLGFVIARAVRKARLDAELQSLRAREAAQEASDDLGLVAAPPRWSGFAAWSGGSGPPACR